MPNSTSRRLLAAAIHLALGGASLSAMAAEPAKASPSATDSSRAGKETQLGKISVDDTVSEYKVDAAESPK